MERYDEMLFELGNGLVEELGFKLVTVDDAVEHGRRVFRFTIDREQGVGIDDCAAVSRELEYLLDAEPGMPDNYVLEVSSPGLDHELRKPREYEHFVGRRARLVLREKTDGGVIKGVLSGIEGDTIKVIPEGEDEARAILLTSIAKARLEL